MSPKRGRGLPHAEEVKKFWGLPPKPGMTHASGSRAAVFYGCDCAKCLPSGRRRKARPEGENLTRTERNRRLRAAKKDQPVPEDVAHGEYAYRIYGCRCSICRAAKREREQKRIWGWLDLARGGWDIFPDKMIVHWPPANAGPDWTCPECGWVRNPEEQTWRSPRAA